MGRPVCPVCNYLNLMSLKVADSELAPVLLEIFGDETTVAMVRLVRTAQQAAVFDQLRRDIFSMARLAIKFRNSAS